MDNARANAVLEAARELFHEEESHGHPAVISDGLQRIGGKLGYPPAEVRVLLRMLHRKGLIALADGFGQIAIANDSSLLQLPTVVVTDGGRGAKLSKGRRSRPPEVTAEEEERPPEAELLEYIKELERMLDEAQAGLEQSEKRRRNITDARNRSDEAKTAVEEQLRLAKAENRALKTEADKVPGLERQIAELQGKREIPPDLAATIARLTQ